MKLPVGEGLLRTKFRDYQRHSREKHGEEIKMSFEEYSEIVKRPCFYCGDQPPMCELRACRPNNGPCYAHGMDRIDNNIGYHKDNCVSCCTTCNSMKSKMLTSVFLDKVRKIFSIHGG